MGATERVVAETLERQVTSKLRESGLVVWLDKDGLYTQFVDELAERRQQGNFHVPVLAYRGSYLELLLALEKCAEGLDPEPLLLHLPGHTDQTVRSTPLLEAYKAGTRFERALPTLVLGPLTRGQILESTGLRDESWGPVINHLLATGRLCKEGRLKYVCAGMAPEAQVGQVRGEGDDVTLGGASWQLGISLNDVRSRILPVPRALLSSTAETTVTVTINGETRTLTLNRARQYVAGVTDVYRNAGLLLPDDARLPGVAVWEVTPDNNWHVQVTANPDSGVGTESLS